MLKVLRVVAGVSLLLIGVLALYDLVPILLHGEAILAPVGVRIAVAFIGVVLGFFLLLVLSKKIISILVAATFIFAFAIGFPLKTQTVNYSECDMAAMTVRLSLVRGESIEGAIERGLGSCSETTYKLYLL